MYVCVCVCVYVYLNVQYTFARARPTWWAICMRQIEPSCKSLYYVEADISVCRRYTFDLVRRSLFAAEHTNQQFFCSKAYKSTVLLQQSIQIKSSFASQTRWVLVPMLRDGSIYVWRHVCVSATPGLRNVFGGGDDSRVCGGVCGRWLHTTDTKLLTMGKINNGYTHVCVYVRAGQDHWGASVWCGKDEHWHRHPGAVYVHIYTHTHIYVPWQSHRGLSFLILLFVQMTVLEDVSHWHPHPGPIHVNKNTHAQTYVYTHAQTYVYNHNDIHVCPFSICQDSDVSICQWFRRLCGGFFIFQLWGGYDL